MPMAISSHHGPPAALRAEAADESQGAALDEHIARLAAWERMSTAHYERGRAYTGFILAAGYAAFLTIWNGVEADLPAAARFGSVFLLGVSLLFFVGYELVKSHATAMAGHALHSEIHEDASNRTLTERLAAGELKAAKCTAFAVRVWPVFFFGAAGTGILGSLMLVFALLDRYIRSVSA